MAYLNLDPNYFDHAKTRRLVGLLGPMSEVLPLRLWAYCAKLHPKDGVMKGYSEAELMAVLGITEPLSTGVNPIKAMLRTGFLNRTKTGYSCVDWRQHQGHLEVFHRRAKEGAKARWGKYEKAHASSIAPSIAPTVPSVPTGPTEPSKPPVPNGGRTGIENVDNGQKPDKARMAEEVLLDQTWKFKGDFLGVRIRDLPADYCQWAISNLVKLGPDHRLGCEIVLKRKMEDCAR